MQKNQKLMQKTLKQVCVEFFSLYFYSLSSFFLDIILILSGCLCRHLFILVSQKEKVNTYILAIFTTWGIE